jgi:O-antigen/teichoic acid export membrane protein
MVAQQATLNDSSPVTAHPRKSFSAGACWAAMGKAATAVLTVVSMGLLSRVLNPVDMAAYVLALSIVAFGSPVGALGLNMSILRFVAQALGRNQATNISAMIRTVLGAVIVGSALVAGVFFGVSGWLCGSVFQSAALASIAGPLAGWMMLQSVNLVVAEAFRGFHDIRSASTFGGLLHAFLFCLAATVLVLFDSIELAAVLYLAVACSLLNLLAALAFLYLRVAQSAGPAAGSGCGLQRPSLGSILAESLPLMGTAVASLAMTQTDLWVVAAYCPQRDVAVYGAVARVMAVITMPLVIANAVIPPMIAGLHSQGRRQDIEAVLRCSANLAAIPTAIAMLLVASCGGWMLEMLFGPAYRHGATMLLILSLGQTVVVWGGSAGWLLIMTGHARLTLGIAITALVVLYVFASLAASQFGATGVALVSAVIASANKIVLVAVARLRLGIWSHCSLGGAVQLLRTFRPGLQDAAR